MAMKGARMIAARKQTAVDREAIPVLPPAAMPAPHSTTVATVEIPQAAPAMVATESHSMDSFMYIALPCSSTRPACLQAPSRVPRESKIVTSRKLMTRMMTGKMPFFIMSAKSTARKETLAKSANFWPMFMSKLAKEVTPRGIPTMVAARMPIRMLPLTRLTCRAAMTTRPNRATRGGNTVVARSAPSFHAAKLARPTRVPALATTIPALFMPMMVMNRPIPAVIADLTDSGIASTIAIRIPVTVRTRQMIPDSRTMARAPP